MGELRQLDTPGHAHRGLMRAHVNVRDFADPRRGAFQLDAAATGWRRTGGCAAVARDTLARFSYPPAQ